MKRNQLIKNRNITYPIDLLRLAVAPELGHGYAGRNVTEECVALLSLTVNSYNTAIGLFALFSNTGGNLKTAVSTGIVLSDSIVALLVIPWLVRALASAKAIWRALTDGQERKQETPSALADIR
jgi:hypothetical protein